jgi:hypothetical protein
MDQQEISFSALAMNTCVLLFQRCCVCVHLLKFDLVIDILCSLFSAGINNINYPLRYYFSKEGTANVTFSMKTSIILKIGKSQDVMEAKSRDRNTNKNRKSHR